MRNNNRFPRAELPKGPIEKPIFIPDFSILTISGYFQKHFKYCQMEETQIAAFDKLEMELEELQQYLKLPLKHRYSCYESFRVGKTRFYKSYR